MFEPRGDQTPAKRRQNGRCVRGNCGQEGRRALDRASSTVQPAPERRRYTLAVRLITGCPAPRVPGGGGQWYEKTATHVSGSRPPGAGSTVTDETRSRTGLLSGAPERKAFECRRIVAARAGVIRPEQPTLPRRSAAVAPTVQPESVLPKAVIGKS